MVLIPTMASKEKEEYGMEQAKKNWWKQWAHIWTKQVLEIIHYHKWPVKKSLKLLEEINQIGRCNQEQNLHGSLEELLTFRAVTLQDQRNIHHRQIEIIEIKYIQLVNLCDSICQQVLQEYKNRFHICMQLWVMV